MAFREEMEVSSLTRNNRGYRLTRVQCGMLSVLILAMIVVITVLLIKNAHYQQQLMQHAQRSEQGRKPNDPNDHDHKHPDSDHKDHDHKDHDHTDHDHKDHDHNNQKESNHTGNDHDHHDKDDHDHTNDQDHKHQSSNKSSAVNATSYRLPTHFTPISYIIRLLPFIREGNFTFNGHAELHIEATVLTDTINSTSNITLHAKDMDIDNQSVQVRDSSDGRKIKIEDFKYDNERDFFIIMLGEPTPKGRKYNVSISFVGNLNDKMAGFYRSSYQDDQAGTQWMAVTQFEATDARRAFPCFDEPALKAKFDITLGRETNMTAVSNMPLQETRPITGMEGYVWDRFQETVPMSTYLVAFMISKLEYKQHNPLQNQTMFRIWSRASVNSMVDYARKIGPQILTFFEGFFDIKYPLPKQDMAAIPDFAAGAMENWGLITYRETALLYSNKTSSASDKQWVAMVVAHELAHQWFGNLVSPYWWDDLWLNEGFASYMEFIGTHHVEPQWQILEQFVVSVVQTVMTTDALETSHPLSMTVDHPDEISLLFDSITYDKGASIIRMMRHFLTAETFGKSLNNYLIGKAYQAATHNDLWGYLTEQAHKDKTLPPNVTVKEIMDTWTIQMGYPVIQVDRDYTNGTAAITQTRFLLNGAQSSESSLWWVPISYASQDRPHFNVTQPQTWLAKQRQMVIDSMPSENHWVIFNIQETGFFKVNYDQTNWQMIIKQLQDNHTLIHTANRAQLIDDSFDLARAGKIRYEIPLGIAKYLRQEKNYEPWKTALANLDYVATQLATTPVFGNLTKVIRGIISQRYEEIGFDESTNDTHSTKLSRSMISSWACLALHEDCMTRCKQLFAQVMQDRKQVETIPTERRGLVYCQGIKYGMAADWEIQWQNYLQEDSPDEKSRMLRSLTCTDEIWLLNTLLDKLLHPDTSGIRKQDAGSIFHRIYSKPVGRAPAWSFLNNNMDRIIEVYGHGGTIPNKLVRTLKHAGNTEYDLQQLRQFFKQYKRQIGQGQTTIRQAIENTENNIKWMKTNYRHFVQTLEKMYLSE